MSSSPEHQWLSRIVNSSGDAIIVIDKDRVIRFANIAAAAVADVGTPAKLVGLRYDDILRQSNVYAEDGTPADPEDFPSIHVFKNGRSVSGKIYERVYKGSHAWLSVDATPLTSESGNVEFCIIRYADISDEKWRRDRLEFLVRSEKMLSLTTDYRARLIEKARLTVPSMADWCTLNIVRRDGSLERVAVVHRDAQKEEAVRRLAELSEIELGENAGVNRVVKTGEPFYIPEVSDSVPQQPHVSSERQELIDALQVCSAMTLPIVSRGSVVGALSVAYAESRRKYSERDLEFMREFCHHLGIAVDNVRLYEDIKARDQAKDDFLATLSHELRNPLAPIKSSLEILALADDLRIHEHELIVVQKQFDHLTSILNDLLDVTRYVRGKIKLDKQFVDLAQLLRDVVRGYAPLASERGIRLEALIPEYPVLIWGDPVRLRQAAMNLLDNAQKFTSADGAVLISLEDDRESVSISFRDTGVGIPKNEIEHVFDLYFQGSNKGRAKHAGLGLGLVLVKNIVDLHQGRIEATSDGPGTGTQFRITLPVLRPLQTLQTDQASNNELAI